jgi:hypothetical protein
MPGPPEAEVTSMPEEVLRLRAVIDEVASSIAPSEAVEVRGLLAAGEAQLALEQLVRFLFDRDVAVPGWVKDEIAVLADRYGSPREGLDTMPVR